MIRHILTSYLIDAANNYASSSAETGNPLELTPQPTAELNVHGDYYVIGALNIHKKREAVFDLNTMTVKSGNNTITGAFISDANGNRKSDQTIANYIDKDFYVAVPKSKVNGSSINIISHSLPFYFYSSFSEQFMGFHNSFLF